MSLFSNFRTEKKLTLDLINLNERNAIMKSSQPWPLALPILIVVATLINMCLFSVSCKPLYKKYEWNNDILFEFRS